VHISEAISPYFDSEFGLTWAIGVVFSIRELRRLRILTLKNQQLSLKPQDLVVLLKLVIAPSEPMTYAGIGQALFISASEAHASLARARAAQLVTFEESGRVVIARGSFRELLLHGARFVFPAVTGALLRGVPTAHASPALRDLVTQSDEPPPVWPYAKGPARGIAVYPLYPTVPQATENDPKLYQALALFDALRIGRSREREIASSELSKLIT